MQMSKFPLWHPKRYQILEVLPLRGTTSIPAPKSWEIPPPGKKLQGGKLLFRETLVLVNFRDVWKLFLELTFNRQMPNCPLAKATPSIGKEQRFGIRPQTFSFPNPQNFTSLYQLPKMWL